MVAIGLRTGLMLLFLLGLIGCTTFTPNQHINSPRLFNHYPTEKRLDKNGQLEPDRRIEKLKARGCADNSLDCGRSIGW